MSSFNPRKKNHTDFDPGAHPENDFQYLTDSDLLCWRQAFQ